MIVKPAVRRSTCSFWPTYRATLGGRLALVSALLVLLIGAPAVTAQPLAGPDSETLADQALLKKLAGYIDCINDHTNEVARSRQRYLSWLTSAERGPTGKEDVVYGLYALQDQRRCRDAVASARDLPPSDPPLEQAAQNFVQTLAAADAVVKEADAYYSLQDYEDDQMQKGMALHPRLMAAFAAFEAASDALYARVVSLQDAVTERRLQVLAQDPAQRDEFLIEQLMLRAKQALDAAHGIREPGFAPEPFNRAVDALQRAWSDFDTFRQANPEHPHSAYRQSTFASAAFDLLKSTKAARRRVADGFTFDDGETTLIEAHAAQLVDGHPVQMVEKYNAFVAAANSPRH